MSGWCSTPLCRPTAQFHRDLLFHQTDEIALPAVLYRPGVRGRAAAGRAVGRDGPDRAGGLAAIERLRRPSARGRPPHRAEDSALRARVGAADPAVDSRRGGRDRARTGNWSKRPWPFSTPPTPRCCSRPCSLSSSSKSWPFDPRAYDFDHPVNKRPNYLFGQWDMTSWTTRAAAAASCCSRSPWTPCSTGLRITAACRASRCSSRKRPCWRAR